MKLSTQQFDFLTEIVNIGIGRSANVLNKIVKNRVQLKVPSILLLKVDDLKQLVGHDDSVELSVISMGFTGDLLGSVALVFSSANAIKMVDLLTENNYEKLEMDQLRTSTLNEVGNIVLNSLIGTLGNLLKTRFRYSIPQFKECLAKDLLANTGSLPEYFIYAETQFKIKDNNIEGSFMLFFEVGSFDTFIEKLEKFSIQ
ncbi:MAG: hypothetical protein M0P66_15370 [Salinivirgaceae bacterium]|nr:hypothetical protein [Salinivirgaceae bacterium]